MIKTISISIITLIFMNCLIHASSPDGQAQRLIEALEANGMYHEAITEYKRLLFFNQLSSEERGMIWMKQAIAHRALNQETEMMKSFDHASRCLKDSKLINQLYSEIAVFFLSRGKSEWAREFLKRMDPQASDIQYRYIILSYLIDENWALFFKFLENGGYSRNSIRDIKRIVNKIRRNNRKFKILNIIDKIIPGLGYLFYGDVMKSGKTLLFHEFLFNQILREVSIPGRIIYAFALVRLFTKTIAQERSFLIKKMKKIKLKLERRIFLKLFEQTEN
jgi:tetratricopeptide (TPR) repeat protein